MVNGGTLMRVNQAGRGRKEWMQGGKKREKWLKEKRKKKEKEEKKNQLL
jgi:hypothetical protein